VEAPVYKGVGQSPLCFKGVTHPLRPYPKVEVGWCAPTYPAPYLWVEVE